MSDVVISVKNVSKSYSVFKSNFAKLLYSLGLRKAKPQELVWALRNINFEIKRGEAVAIIGRNGAGKSSLLEILTGTLKSTEGQVNVNGKVSALLELGSGFDPELTGRENVVLNGLLLGLSKDEVIKRFPEIEAFAEIGDAINRPIKTYSSGMVMRLAFSVQVLCNPGILIIDEALSVGDFFFQQKCFARLKAMIQEGLTLLFVSHDMGSVNQFCNRAIYLESGKICFSGEKKEAIRKYLAAYDEPSKLNLHQPLNHELNLSSVFSQKHAYTWLATEDLLVSKGAGFVSLALKNKDNELTNFFGVCDEIIIEVLFVPDIEKKSHIFFNITNNAGEIVFTGGTPYLQLDQPNEVVGGMHKLRFCIEARLQAGNYSLSFTQGLHQYPNRLGAVIDKIEAEKIGPLTVNFNYKENVAPFLGPFGLPVSGAYLKEDF